MAGPPTPPDPRAGRRVLVAVVAALLVAALAAWGAARLTWFTAAVDAVGRGRLAVAATGADLVPALPGLALLALAAVAAAVALAGAVRRALGVLLAAVGAYAGLAVARALLARPAPADLGALPGAPAGAVGVPGSVAPGPGLPVAVAAAALLLAAGAVLVVAEPRLPRFGARHAVRPPAGEVAGGAAAVDPDRAAWDALDAGRDPTADPAPAVDAPVPRRSHRTDGGGPNGPD